ncbi:MAG: cupin domain-containing protein [Nitrospira sp.]|nr:cupin domain-containing protein [Nitrospira sp.]
MDVLSEVLKAVKLDGALFYNAEYSAPWCFRAPASFTLVPYLSSDPRQAWVTKWKRVDFFLDRLFVKGVYS